MHLLHNFIWAYFAVKRFIVKVSLLTSGYFSQGFLTKLKLQSSKKNVGIWKVTFWSIDNYAGKINTQQCFERTTTA
jgi:hypothetical protein